MYSIDKTYYLSPLGVLEIITSHHAVFAIKFLDGDYPISNEIPRSAIACITQLNEYFNRERNTFDLQLQPDGTPFQRHVWDELLKIPYGKTMSYLQLARKMGDEKSIRAVAAANGKNPIGIVIPCHRVVGSGGELTGYAGGLHRKEWLLAFEKGEEQLNLF